MATLKQIGSPDEVVGFLMEELCVADPSGMTLQGLWDALIAQNGEIDNFTKKLVWSWLIKEEELIVCNKAGIPVDKSKAKNLKNLNENEHRLKVTQDRQSIYLLGVPMASNSLGTFPYELLRVITKSREKGITAKALADATGQDPRSFTGRLANLTDLDAIKKIPIITNGVNTSLIINSKYADDPRFILNKSHDVSMLSKIGAATEILNMLKKAPNGVRTPLDLRAEMKFDTTKRLTRHFSLIIKALESLDCLNIIFVKVDASEKQLSALQYVKDLPRDMSNSQFSSILEQAKDAGSEIIIGTPEIEETKEKTPDLNRFFPLQTQLFDATVSAGETGISSMDLGKQLIGANNLRTFMKFIAFASSEKIVKGPGAYTIVRGQDTNGKVKYYRYIHQPLFLKRKGLPVEEVKDHFKPVKAKDLELCLAQYSSKHYSGACSRIQAIPFANHSSGIWWYGYSGKLINSELLNVRNKFKSGKLILDEDQSEIPITASSKKSLSILKKDPAEKKENIKSLVKKEVTPLAIMNTEDDTHTEKDNVTPKGTPDVEVPEELDILFSTEKTNRNDFLLNYINKSKIVAIDSLFCAEVKKEMNLEFLPDVKTLRKDAYELRDKGLVTITTPQHPYRLHNLFVVSSVTNKPNEEDEQTLFRSMKRGNRSKPTKTSSIYRPLSDAPIVEVAKLHFFADPIAAQRLKKETQERNKALKQEQERSVNEMIDKRLTSLTKEPKKRSKKKSSTKKRASSETSLETEDNKPEGENSEFADVKVKEEDEGIDMFIPHKKRKKLNPRKKTESTAQNPVKKNRTTLKVDIRDTMLILRSVIILQSLSPHNNIDWAAVASLFSEYKDVTADSLRKQWPRLKKEVGNKVLQETRTSWEKIVLKCIKNGELTKGDLIKGDLVSMLDLWRKLDESSFEGVKNSLFRDIEDNYHNNKFVLDYSPQGVEVFRDLLSVVEREEAFNKTSFTYPVEEDEEDTQEYRDIPNEMDLFKIKLKALFATSPEKFSTDRVKSLFTEIGEENSKKTISELENSREIAFLGEDADIKFTLTERSLSLLETKFNEKMLDNATMMYDLFEDLTLSSQGLILSKKIPDGCYFPIVNAIAERSAKFTRIDVDQDDLTKNYSTRQLNKSKFESDFILGGYSKEKIDDQSIAIKSIPLPIGKPCSRLWIDLSGDLNRKIWIKSLLVLLQSIVQRPGVTFKLLVKRLTPLLTAFEIRDLLNWLEAKNGIRRIDYDGYCAEPNWYLVLNK